MTPAPNPVVRACRQPRQNAGAIVLALCLAAVPPHAARADSTAPPPREVVHEPGEIVGRADLQAAFPAPEVITHRQAVVGIMSRPHPRQDAPTRQPAVLLVHDSHGFDARSSAYVHQLLGASLAVLEVELRSLSVDGGDPGEEEPDPLQRALSALSTDARVDAGRIGAVGFGEGARALLLADGLGALSARVLLYPGCGALASALAARQGAQVSPQAAVLIMHGTADRANSTEDCARLAGLLAATGSEVGVIAWPEATYGWDMPLPEGAGGSRVPAPDGDGYVPVEAWRELTALSATRTAAHLAAALQGEGR